MKPLFIIFLLFSAIITIAQGNDSIKTIKHGYFAGECYGYCYQDETYDSVEVITTGHISIGGDDKRRPALDTAFIIGAIDSIGTAIITHPENETTVVKSKIRKGKWKRMISSVNLNTFYALPKVIGCPDCTDGGGEWIEIICTHSSYKITFDALKRIEEILPILQILRSK